MPEFAEEIMNKLVRYKQAEELIRSEFEYSLPGRIQRSLETRPLEIVPATYFAPVSAQCWLLFRDGYDYACIALTQAVAEALVRFICRKNGWRPGKEYTKNIETLFRRELISRKIKSAFHSIWQQRHDYHHLNPNVSTDLQQLEKLAKQKLDWLSQVEKELFDYKIIDGVVLRKHPKYWEGGKTVWLRITP